MKARIMGFFLCLLVGFLLFFAGMDMKEAGSPVLAYQVYLNGEKIGLISSKDKLLNLIDETQSAIREQYHVDKVYPPAGLDIQKIYTFNDNIETVDKIYNKIKEAEPFTIEGYKVSIIYTKDRIVNDTEVIKAGKPVYLYMMNKDIISEALYKTAAAFIGKDNLKKYDDSMQVEITDTGSIITSVYFDETITVKKDLISTNEKIYEDSDELSRYLLFGTLDKQDTYTVKDGEDLSKIAEKNHLNIDELMVANPQFTSSTVLLSEGEEVNVGLIKPIINVVYRKTVVEDVVVPYNNVKEKDNTKYTDYKEVKQAGSDGLSRVTQDIKYVNGEINSLVVTAKEEIKPVVDEITVVGTKTYGGGYYTYTVADVTGDWYWPTITPFMFSSKFEWRGGRQHLGIDITGCGSGSPIFAANDGVVSEAGFQWSMGNYVLINHGNGYFTQYMHLKKKPLVSVGQMVARGEKIGEMGSTGNSTGTHLHFGVWKGVPYVGGVALNPCTTIFKC